MLIKLMIALTIAVVLSFIPNLKIGNMRSGISDIDKQNMICVMDQAIMQYYYSHSGQLPSSLNSSMLKITGLNNSWTNFTYSCSGNRFILTATLTDGSVISSPNSNKTLSAIYDEDSGAKIK